MSCESEEVAGRASISCETNNQLDPLSSECTLLGPSVNRRFNCICGNKIALLFNSYTLFTGNVIEVILGVQDFPPGIYSLFVTVRDVSGQTASQTVDPITLSGRNYHHQLPSQPLFSHKFSEPPLSPVECTLTPEGVAVLCRTPLDGTMVPLTYTCSYNNRPSQDCELGLPFLRREF